MNMTVNTRNIILDALIEINEKKRFYTYGFIRCAFKIPVSSG